VDGTQPDLDATEAKAVLAFCLAAVESKQTGRTTLLAELDQEETKA
jgi:hypothetical protein